MITPLGYVAGVNPSGEPRPKTAERTNSGSNLAQPRNAKLRQDAGHRVHSTEKRLIAA